jgi:hypothetical protein
MTPCSACENMPSGPTRSLHHPLHWSHPCPTPTPAPLVADEALHKALSTQALAGGPMGGIGSGVGLLAERGGTPRLQAGAPRPLDAPPGRAAARAAPGSSLVAV